MHCNKYFGRFRPNDENGAKVNGEIPWNNCQNDEVILERDKKNL